MDSELGSIAAQLVSDGGILASDESPPTLGKRLVKAGLENDEVIESFEFLFFLQVFRFCSLALNLNLDLFNSS